MKVNEEDYLVCRRMDNPKKNFLMQVTSVREIEIDGMLEKDKHIEQEEVTVNHGQILINLGKKPHPDLKAVAGVDVRDVYRKTITHDIWGDIHFFIKPNKEVIDALKKSLDKTGEKLERLGLGKVFPKLTVEIRYQHGKYAGMYKHKDGPKKINRMHFYLKHENDKEMNYILYHEFGHAVRYNLLSDARVHSSWIRKFNTSIQVDPIEENELTRLLKALLKADVDRVSQFYGTLDDREKLVFQQAMRFIQKIHRISKRELNSLLTTQNVEAIEDIWPAREIAKNEIKPIVSEYACKNPEELFAEAFSFRLLGKKLPKSIIALTEKSLSFAKNVPMTEEKDDDDDDE